MINSPFSLNKNTRSPFGIRNALPQCAGLARRCGVRRPQALAGHQLKAAQFAVRANAVNVIVLDERRRHDAMQIEGVFRRHGRLSALALALPNHLRRRAADVEQQRTVVERREKQQRFVRQASRRSRQCRLYLPRIFPMRLPVSGSSPTTARACQTINTRLPFTSKITGEL